LIVTIHQPEHLPWLGLLDKVRQADVFVLLDNVQFRKNYFQNRNRVRTQSGADWITVPVITKGRADQLIRDVEVDGRANPRWMQIAGSTLRQSYRQTRHWQDHEPFFEDIYKREWKQLSELNEILIRYLLEAFSIKVRILKASEIGATGKGTDLLLNVCQDLKAETYLSGISGRDYLNLDAFATASIAVRFQEFHHPIYRQFYEPFLPCMSSVDLLFNHGSASIEILQGIGVPTLDEVFR